MSDRQIAWAVARGRRMTALVEGREVEGYVCGSDSYHWCVVGADGLWLVHKSSTVRIGADGDLAAEPAEVQARVEQVGASFRQRVVEAEGATGVG